MKERFIPFPLAGMLALSFLILPSLSCSQNTEAARELSRLTHLVGKLRSAKNEHKLPFLEEFRRSSCREHCRYRALCLRAYESHLKALGEIKRARQSLPLGKEETEARLVKAEKSLRSASLETQSCAALEAELKSGRLGKAQH